MTANGIDVASYQSTDYSTADLDFVVVKATEGTGYTNPKHAAQVATAREHGLVVGHYHFARPGSVSAQADYFLKHAEVKAGDFLAFDWEDAGVSGADKDAWLRHVKAKAPGHRVVLYCNRDFWLHRDHTSYCADGLWIADPSAPKGHPRVEHPWLFHQYSEAGGLDRNVGAFTDRAALHAWAAGTTPPQTEDIMQLTDDEVRRIGRQVVTGANGMTGPGTETPWAVSAYLAALHRQGAALTAQVAALTATVGALAQGGGLTAAEITTAAEAGAQAALDRLGDALTPDTPAAG